MNAHDLDLRKRYQEIDYVSEFQRYWSMFNRWFRSETAHQQDRDAIEALKVNARFRAALVAASVPDSDPLLAAGIHQSTSDYLKYAQHTLAADFAAACWAENQVKSRMNTFGTGIVDRVRPTALVHISIDEYRQAYSRCQEALMDYMHDQMSMENIFAYVGISSSGSCYFRDPNISFNASSDQRAYLDDCWNRISAETSLSVFDGLRKSVASDGLEADLIELLYLVRNLAVHGDFDFLIETQNEVARSALTLLQTSIRNLIP